MKILHTSDWHLGRSFHREDLLAAQGVWADHLVQLVHSERVDVVVVAGDIYDRALPHVDAVKLADELLCRLAGTGARVIVTSGNHDSAMRLGFGSRLLDHSGLHLRTDASSCGVPVIVEDAHGPVRFYPLPWLEPEAVRVSWGLGVRSHEAALGAAMTRVRADLAAQRASRSVVVAHAFVAGSQPSESERDISVGGVDRVPTSVFDGIDYVALGHLHRAQQTSPTLHYSGSPLAYSFSEAGQAKGSWLVDLGRDGRVQTEFVEAPVPRRLARLRGELSTLLTDPTLSEHEGDWLQITLTDELRPPRPMEQLRRRFPHALVLTFESAARPVVAPDNRTPGEHESPVDIAVEFIRQLRGVEATASERALLQQASDACCADPEVDVVMSSGPTS